MIERTIKYNTCHPRYLRICNGDNDFISKKGIRRLFANLQLKQEAQANKHMPIPASKPVDSTYQLHSPSETKPTRSYARPTDTGDMSDSISAFSVRSRGPPLPKPN